MEPAKKQNIPYSMAPQASTTRSAATSMLPALEQSTRLTNSRSVAGIEKRIPKSVLAELQTTRNNNQTNNMSIAESNFFLTQYGDASNLKKISVRKSNTQQDIRVRQPKQKLEIIMGELETAISRLKNLRRTQPSKKKVRSSDSSFDEKEKTQAGFFQDQMESVIKGGQRHALEIQSNNQIIQKRQQADLMQENLTNGLNHFNRVLESVKERERKLQQLQRQLLKIVEEEELIQALRGEETNSVDSLQKEIDYFEEQLQRLSMERSILSSMKDRRKRDLEIISEPYLKDKDVLEDLNNFLQKETENLVKDAKAIDDIREQWINLREEKRKLEGYSLGIQKDSDIHRRNYANLEKVINDEIEFTQFQHDLQNQLKIDKEQSILQRKKLIYEEERAAEAQLEDLKRQFTEIASLVPVLEKEQDVLLHFADIRKTNQFLKDKREATIKSMKQTRIEIQQMQENLAILKTSSCVVQENDELQVEMEEFTQNGLNDKLSDETFLLMLARQEVRLRRFRAQRLTKLQMDLRKGLRGIQEEFEFNMQIKIGDSPGAMTMVQMADQLKQMIQNLTDSFQQLNISTSELENLMRDKQIKAPKKRVPPINPKNSHRTSEKDLQDEQEHSDSSC